MWDPEGKALTPVLNDTVTFVDALEAKFPPVEDRSIHVSLAEAVQFTADRPLFVMVYTLFVGVKGPPSAPADSRSDTGVTRTSASARVSASIASTMPAPESLSNPDASMSSAELNIIVRMPAEVVATPCSISRAAMAARCGADADVPKKGSKPGVAVDTPSAPVTSGLGRTAPPVDEKLPGVMGVPSA